MSIYRFLPFQGRIVEPYKLHVIDLVEETHVVTAHHA
jgi:hypothetical protein